LIEQAMIFALGFFVAGLLALLFLPAVQRRAARLSARRLEMQLPLSMEEIVAERDQLRAEFAVERRRIEQKLEAAGEAAAEHMGEIGRHTATINDLNGQLTNTREELRAVGEAKDALHRAMTETEATLAATRKALQDESVAHGATRESLETLRGEYAALEQVTHEQRASVAGLETRAAALDLRIVALNHQKEGLERNLQSKTSEAEVLLVERDLTPAERDGLETKRATLQRRLDEEALRAADLRDQIEALRRRVGDADRTRLAGEQTRDAAEQRRAEATRQVQEYENRIRALQSAAEERHAAQVAEVATLSGQLETARREHASLRDERRPREKEAAQTLEAEIAKARQAEAEWQARHAEQQQKIIALTAALEEARQQHAAMQQDSRDREAKVQSKLEAELKKARDAEAEWQARHENQSSEIASLVTFLNEAQGEKQTSSSGTSAAGHATHLPDQSISQRDETALLRQAIADLGSEVVRIAGSLKEPNAPEDGGPMPSDVIGVRDRRGRARAQT
jgi:chromosome segregation ATPase